ncbi:MAG TPA: response regulator [Terriglobales bacterium]
MSANPVVYFIDDSATMREVIKIAFRRENINVVACHDAVSAMDMMDQNAPDVVISDVIMPDKDGYEVCQYIKQHPTLGRTPVILMSGVVNKQVAERAFAVKADELIRKPFQPQDLITRVRHLLNPKAPAEAQPVAAPAAAAALSSIFAAQPGARPVTSRPATPAAAARPLTPAASAAPAPRSQPVPAPAPIAAPAPSRVPAPPGTMDSSKMRLEIMRLMSQIKKLESELQAEREYSHALEEHIKTLQENE